MLAGKQIPIGHNIEMLTKIITITVFFSKIMLYCYIMLIIILKSQLFVRLFLSNGRWMLHRGTHLNIASNGTSSRLKKVLLQSVVQSEIVK